MKYNRCFVFLVLSVLCISITYASITNTPKYQVSFIKNSGLEKHLFYNYQFNITERNLTIDVDINTTVYTYLRNIRVNWNVFTPQERMSACLFIRDYIIDDYPNFDCYNSNHTTMLKNRLFNVIDTGWEVLHRDNLQEYITLNRSHIQITIPNINDRDRIQIGNFTTILEITLSNIGIFNNTFFNATGNFVQLNLSLNSNGTYTSIVQNFTSIPISEGDTINVTAVTTLPTGTNMSVKIRTKTLNLTDDLIAYWDFDGDDLGVSTCKDISGNGNDGIINSGSIGIVSDGFDDQGYSDNGVDGNNEGCVITGHNFLGKESFTIYYVFTRVTTDPPTQILFSNGDQNGGLDIAIQGRDTLRFRVDGLSDEQKSSGIGFGFGTFKIFSFYNGSHICNDIDGSTSCDASTGTPTDFSTNMVIGNNKDGNGVPMNGTLDDIIIFNESLNAQQRACIRDGICLENWTDYTPSCDLSTNATGCLFPRTGNFTQSRFSFTTENTSLTPLLHNFTYTIQNVTAPPVGDTCTYTSGNWEVDCSDDCSITSNVDLLGNNISIIGTGTFTTTANISNYNLLHIEGTSSSDRCFVRCLNGGCFKG